MRHLYLAAMLPLIVTDCAAAPGGEAACDGTAESRSALAAALVDDGGPKSMAAGRTLIARLDAACEI